MEGCFAKWRRIRKQKRATAPVLNLCRDNAISRVSRREVVGHARGDVNSKWPLRSLCLSTIVTHSETITHVRALWEKQTRSCGCFFTRQPIYFSRLNIFALFRHIQTQFASPRRCKEHLGLLCQPLAPARINISLNKERSRSRGSAAFLVFHGIRLLLNSWPANVNMFIQIEVRYASRKVIPECN